MRLFIVISAFFLAAEAIPMPDTNVQIQARDVRRPYIKHPLAANPITACPPGSQPGSIKCPYRFTPPPQLEFLVKPKANIIRRCPPGVLHGSINCPFTTTPSPQLETPANSGSNDDIKAPTGSKNTTYSDPVHDKLVLACGNDLNSCQVCKSPHTNCEAAHFQSDSSGHLQVCLKRKDLYCAPVPLAIWDSLSEDVD